MSRNRTRVPLEHGQRIDINDLIRRGVIPASLKKEKGGTMSVRYPDFAQEVAFVGLPRPYGGLQHYWVCPSTGKLASVLYRPPGAKRFASRHAWAGRVGYQSQFLDAVG